MPIASADLLWKLSINTGPGNSTAQANVNDSIGGFMSSTTIVDNTLNNLFDNISGDSNAASEIDYRGVFVHNNHGTLALQTPKIWISAEVAGGANAAIALDGTGITTATSATAQMERIASETTAPTGEVFSAPTTKATGLAPANIPAGSVVPIWIRRTATNSAAINNDGATFTIEGDTAA